MANALIAALSLIVGIATGPATNPGSAPVTAAPSAPPDAKYCMRVAPATGSLVEQVRCWTRREWTEQGVDIDKEWAKEGVTVITDRPYSGRG